MCYSTQLRGWARGSRVPWAKNQSRRAREVKDRPSMGSSAPLSNTHPQSPSNHHTKISVNVVGNVGNAIAQTIRTQDLVDELVVVDAKPDKLRGEMLDLQHAVAFLPRLNLLMRNLAMYKDTEFSSYLNYLISIAGGSIGVRTGASEMIHCSKLRLQKVAMVRNDASEQRCNLWSEPLPLFRRGMLWLYKLAFIHRYCARAGEVFTGVYIVDCIKSGVTYVAWKLSGFSANRVIGSGTNLDSSRFRFLIADHLDVNAQDVQAYIVGEHGDSSVALCSSISVGGIPLLRFLERQQIAIEMESLENIHKQRVLELACTAW
ncbi:hypothetical protein CQW23_18373 [Capsicum baccatum]|uniref:L-lactate dehydrogenase n=1 Tax=Capsicum baccatum TaxID=33114 RepID=A0A2G2W2V5_CAPBA|nr:hypothetical protein CQW23_18373 [Capsicum baccatum]